MFRWFAEKYGWGPDVVGKLSERQIRMYMDESDGGRFAHYDTLSEALAAEAGRK